jgi:hypothetical protein
LASAATASESIPLSKSQQLARAVAAADKSNDPTPPHFRPDSLWSEGGADVIWHGKSTLNNAGLPSSAFPSPGLQGSMHASTEESQGEFADADEGTDSDEMHSASADDNTLTTLSTASGAHSARRALGAHTVHSIAMPLGLAKTNVSAAPKRPQRKAPRPPFQMDDSHDDFSADSEAFGSAVNAHIDDKLIDDDADDVDGNSHFGHTRNVSIGSSIWAGRGAKALQNNKENLGALPPVPVVPHSMRSPLLDAGRASMAETSSLYSQGGVANEWDDPANNQDAQRLLEQTPPLDRLCNLTSSTSPGRTTQNDRDDEFEMMDTRSIHGGKVRSSSTSPAAMESTQTQRRLPDGTVVPKMPPMPSDPYSMFTSDQSASSKTRTRTQRGRRNRSPVLSYADGEEEERRLVQESEMREHGGVEMVPTSSSLGPKLKKNTPAPWEMDDEIGGGNGLQDSGIGMSATRPSTENLLSASAIKNPSNWARQSMEQFRNRSASDKGTSPNMPSLPSSATARVAAFPSSTSQHGGTSPLTNEGARSVSAGTNSQNLSVEDATPVRRSRTKSVSGSAAGMLKGLGLASSTSSASGMNAPSKKASSSRLAKAFRSSSKTNTSSSTSENSSSRKMTAMNLSRGISSDDYALMPTTSPSQNLSVVGGGHSPYLAQSSATSHSSLSHRSDMAGDLSTHSKAPTDMPSPPAMPKRTASVGMAVNVAPNTSTDGHSYGSSTAQTRNTTALSIGSSADTTGDSSSPHTPLLHTTSKIDASSPVKGAAMPLHSPQSYIGSRQAQTVTADKHDAERGSLGSGHRSQDSQRSAELSSKSNMSFGAASNNVNVLLAAPDASSSGMSRVPSVGAHEGVPYKLISLEEARQQQQKYTVESTDSGLQSSSSDKNVTTAVFETERHLKSKKSGGFLRRFGGKDRTEAPMPNMGDGVGPLPSFGPSVQLQHAHQRELAPAAPPTLSVRPMSSIFTSLSSNLIDSSTFDGHSSSSNAAQLSPSYLGPPRTNLAPPLSPAITVASVDSNPSAADYHDALERSPLVDAPTGSHSKRNVIAVDHAAAVAHDARTLSAAAINSSSVPRASSESARSDGSSALGLVNGFPALPATGHGAIAASLTSKTLPGANGEAPSLARATRQRALEIEAKMAELHGELVRLRTFAVDSGLTAPRSSNPSSTVTSPNPATGAFDAAAADDDTDAIEHLYSSTPPVTPALTSSSGGATGKEDEENGLAAMQMPIPPCHQCGCSCAEQKRVSALNELNVLKGISVLDRGRALKSIAGQNGSKFGGYLDR